MTRYFYIITVTGPLVHGPTYTGTRSDTILLGSGDTRESAFTKILEEATSEFGFHPNTAVVVFYRLEKDAL